MNLTAARRSLFVSHLGSLLVLLVLLSCTAHLLFAHRLKLDLERRAQSIARDVAFAVEHEQGKLQFDESVYLTNRSQHPDLADTAVVQWLDLQGRLVHHQGNLQLDPRPLGNEEGAWQTRPAVYVYTVQSVEHGQPIGYARVGLSRAPMDRQLGELAQVLCLTGLLTLACTAAGSWWWTGRVLQPIRSAYTELSIFTGAVAHELRSPVTALRTNSDSLVTHFDRLSLGELREAVGEIHEVTCDMTQLIEALLLLARLRREEAGQDLGEVDLAALAGEVTEARRPAAADKGVALDLSGCDRPLRVRGRSDYLRMVVRNLVDNALQYTPAGGTVSLSCSDGELQVRDTGIGMTADELARIYEPFWRAERSRARHLGGAGLGLAITQALLQAQRGSIAVRSALGTGTTFSVRLTKA